jgi:Ca2+-binding RTX toxin-like protein
MAQIRYSSLLPDDMLFTSEYPETMFGSKLRASGFEVHDSDGNYLNYISVHGSGLKYKHGYLVAGTITGVDFKTGDGDDYVTISHAHYKVAQKLDLSDITDAPAGFYYLAESGNDKIVGSSESDALVSSGGANNLKGLGGNDTLIALGRATMTGNAGSDTFVFVGLAKVVITDFDANGGGNDQDYLYFQDIGIKPRIYEDHHNTVLDFGKGHTVTLLHLDRTDFSLVDDFKMPAVYDTL